MNLYNSFNSGAYLVWWKLYDKGEILENEILYHALFEKPYLVDDRAKGEVILMQLDCTTGSLNKGPYTSLKLI